jgi:hypothetical protein
VKKAFHDAPILAYPNFDREFILTTDASKDGIAGTLWQDQSDGKRRAIGFYSRALTAVEVRYNNTTEWECLALVESCKHWHVYLINRPFKVFLDHKPLITCMKGSKEASTTRLQRWFIKLQQYIMDIQHIKGTDNIVSNAWSRKPLAHSVLYLQSRELQVLALKADHIGFNGPVMGIEIEPMEVT